MADSVTLSTRLDAKATAALRALQADGRSRSEVVRDALIEAADRQERAELRAAAEAAANDPEDLAEARAILEFMEALDGPE